MKILLTGGGTAGHAWPVILVGSSLKKNRRADILYIGSRQGIEKELAKKFEIPFIKIHSGKRRTYLSISNVWDIFKIFLGIIEAFFILIWFRPQVIFAKGGYVTVPILWWLKVFKIPLVIHESDVVMGRANLWISRKASKICLGFPIEFNKDNLPLDKLVYTGIPVQTDFLQTQIMSGERPKLLITGGSQGSSKINDLIYEILPDLLTKYDVSHLTGKRDYEKFKTFQDTHYHLYDFTLEMPKLMRDADLVVTRAGAGTLMEVAATSKPAIIIPLESAAGEHQEANAQVFTSKNAAVVVSEKNLTANSLRTIVDNLIQDKEMRQLLSHHAKSLYCQNATEDIIDIIFETSQKKDEN